MKKETREYNYDWMLWSIFSAASKALDGTQKEYESLTTGHTELQDRRNTMLKHGEPGVLFMKMLAEYLDDIMTAHDRAKSSASEPLSRQNICSSPLTTWCLHGLRP